MAGSRAFLWRSRRRILKAGGITDQPATTDDQIREIGEEEGREIFDRNAQRYLGISGEEFLRRWDAGEYDDPDDRTKHGPEVMRVASLLPLAR